MAGIMTCRSLFVRLGTLAVILGCVHITAAPPMPDKERLVCDITLKYKHALESYRILKDQPRNAIQEAQHPLVAPDPHVYDQQILALLGPSGAFDHWYGNVSFNVNDDRFGTHSKVVYVSLGVPCADSQGPVSISIGTLTRTPSPVPNDLLAPYFAEYGMVPLNSALATELGNAKGSIIRGTMSGHLAYRPFERGLLVAGYLSCMDAPRRKSVEKPPDCYLAHFDSFQSIP